MRQHTAIILSLVYMLSLSGYVGSDNRGNKQELITAAALSPISKIADGKFLHAVGMAIERGGADQSTLARRSTSDLVRVIKDGDRIIGFVSGDVSTLKGENMSMPGIALDSWRIKIDARTLGKVIEPDSNERDAIAVYYMVKGSVELEVIAASDRSLGSVTLQEGSVYYGLKGYKYKKIFQEDGVLVEVREEGFKGEMSENKATDEKRLKNKIETMQINMPAQIVLDTVGGVVAGFLVTRETDTGRSSFHVYPPDELALIFGVNPRKERCLAPLHAHTPRLGSKAPRQEMWIVDEGGLTVNVYTESFKYIEAVKLTVGMFCVLVGAHEVAFDPQTRIIELKQGPYPTDPAGDKMFWRQGPDPDAAYLEQAI